MDVVAIRTFLAAAAGGSFAEAAARVNASPSAVTERMKQLEHHLRVRLFDRDKRGCRLTRAGNRFLIPAQNMLRAWEQGCEQAALPARFSQSLRVGGQHALWPSVLIPWLKSMRAAEPETAFRAIAAAPAQLNRGLEDDELDLAFLYEPVIRQGLRIEQLAEDRLILVSANPETAWQDNFARIDWGENATAVLRARLGEWPGAGLELDLGILSLDWLVETGSCGYVPRRLAMANLQTGRLSQIEDAPEIEFSPYVCWRASLGADTIGGMIEKARQLMEGPIA